jgi:deazaflavin-dependent oxidoreductase (nitroreductase family)
MPLSHSRHFGDRSRASASAVGRNQRSLTTPLNLSTPACTVRRLAWAAGGAVVSPYRPDDSDSWAEMMDGLDGASRDVAIRAAARDHVRSHTRLIRSARDGARLSAAMLPLFLVRLPVGFGVITTTGRKTGKPRRKCVRVIRRGRRGYLVQLRPPEVAMANPSAVAGWVLNLRSNPQVRLRIRGGTFEAVVHELVDSAELAEARTAFCETVNWFDYGECDIHVRGFPSRAKIEALHRYWFDTGVPVVAELRS